MLETNYGARQEQHKELHCWRLSEKQKLIGVYGYFGVDEDDGEWLSCLGLIVSEEVEA